jgi:tetratricopeptide (TPR) repeat protein
MGVAFAEIGLLTVILMFSCILLFEPEDSIKGDAGRDQDDFSSANIAGSMGIWDKAVESYDYIISSNQSNTRAWKEIAYALRNLGRYDEAAKSYERSLALNPENEIRQTQLNEALRDSNLINEPNARIGKNATPELEKIWIHYDIFGEGDGWGLHGHILAGFLAMLLLIVLTGASKPSQVVHTDEILKMIEKGQPVEYDSVTIVSDLDISKLELPTVFWRGPMRRKFFLN